MLDAQTQRKLIAIAILTGVGLFVILPLLRKTFTIVPAGNVGVVETFGNVSETPLNPGIHLQNPLSKLVTFSTRLQNVQETIEATSQEGLGFNINVSLQYQIDPQKVVQIYKNIGVSETDIVISQFRSIVREITASYPAEAVYSTKRQEVAKQIQTRLTEQLAPLGFTVDEILLREIQLPEKLQASIQEKLQAEQDNQRMTFVLEKERKEAERKRIEAKGISDSQKIVSQGLNNQILQLRAIEATEKLANSQGTKMVIIGSGKEGLPVLLQPNIPQN